MVVVVVRAAAVAAAASVAACCSAGRGVDKAAPHHRCVCCQTPYVDEALSASEKRPADLVFAQQLSSPCRCWRRRLQQAEETKSCRLLGRPAQRKDHRHPVKRKPKSPRFCHARPAAPRSLLRC